VRAGWQMREAKDSQQPKDRQGELSRLVCHGWLVHPCYLWHCWASQQWHRPGGKVACMIQKKTEAPPGFEPGMSDLQSDALATWLRRLRFVNATNRDSSQAACEWLDKRPLASPARIRLIRFGPSGPMTCLKVKGFGKPGQVQDTRAGRAVHAKKPERKCKWPRHKDSMKLVNNREACYGTPPHLAQRRAKRNAKSSKHYSAA
jgi:hypothetical protein